ncbi:MAG: type II CRISPR-associated endonuclease Cas1 [Erysipelotrichaceae bacterium]|jgi:CRISPR-associated endonuclease Cas1 subtype II|nr:type II CRISPR-associated endonuclease Cas1 [Erysipelotrichaceae bacterium]
MAFRLVVIDTHSKLEYGLGYLIFRTPEETKRVLLDEIHTLLIQSTAVSITSSLIQELNTHKIKVIFCDEKKNPSCELEPYYGSHNSSKRIDEQIHWDKEIINRVWQRIAKEKITNQSKTLLRYNKFEESNLLQGYAKDVMPGDITNREGHAAKVYFNNMYYKGFTRDDDSDINAYLNYGYTILLSQFNRTIVSAGFLTQVGIHHHNDFNEFNLSCDLIEPFRYLVDEKAGQIEDKEKFKDEMINLLTSEVKIQGKSQTIVNAITLYCNTVFNALKTGDVDSIAFLDHDDVI